ncbi:hypothetical protein AB0C04_15025 [Micromonospora sp. NPDC048909]|uniref:hypothetical protein n=1 Tax=Micromonospora sp. NPDC048909 TaxID=3155643 RepID=UPI0033FCEF6B
MTVTAAAVGWRRTILAHRPVDGVCPICRRRKCWPRAAAFANLIATDQYLARP